MVDRRHLFKTITFCRDRGLNLIPLDINKSPLGRWEIYQLRHSTPAELERWYRNGAHRKHKKGPLAGTTTLEPVMNWGVTTGILSGVIVADSDSEDAEVWAADHLPSTPWTVRTRRGFHRWYRHPHFGNPGWTKDAHWVKNFNRGTIKLDVKADGGQVVAPWSVHQTGAVYEPVGDWSVAVEDLPVFDDTWLRPIGYKRERLLVRTPLDAVRAQLARDCPKDDAVTRARQYVARVEGKMTGHRHDAAFKLGNILCRGFALHPVDALDIMREWNTRNSPELTGADLETQMLGGLKRGNYRVGEKLIPLSAALRERAKQRKAETNG